MKMNYTISCYRILFFIVFFIFSFVLVKGQNIIRNINIESIKQTEYETIINVVLENEDEISFLYKFPPPPIYDSYADKDFCVLIFSDENNFSMSAAYRDSIEGRWVIDFPSLPIQKNRISSNIYNVKILDIEAKSGSTFLVTYDIRGNKQIKNREFGEITFPRTSECILIKQGLYNTELKTFVRATFWIDENSPRSSNK